MKSPRLILGALVVVILSLVSGCASLKEALKGVAGISTDQLELARKSAVIKTFDLDYNTCNGRLRKALKFMDSYIYTEDKTKNLIAIYVDYNDTTPVGIFITSLGDNLTKVEVSSPSSFARDLIATKMFGFIENPDLMKEENKIIG